MTVADSTREKLVTALQPARLDMVDISAQHAGHAGARPGGESHFEVTIVSPAFERKSRLERQRPVHGILADELAGPVHAHSLSTRTPEAAAGARTGA